MKFIRLRDIKPGQRVRIVCDHKYDGSHVLGAVGHEDAEETLQQIDDDPLLDSPTIYDPSRI